MSDVVIKVENLSKQYRLGTVGTGTLSHDLNRFFAKVRGKDDPYRKVGESNDRTKKGESDYVWALRDINFEVKRGEILGIIGRNGAGKSTLLKILSQITRPTTGTVKMKGRVGSLLEVGTGFHPDLTGRENIYTNGAILGMRKWEIDKRLDAIIDFAGVERYIDTPVKRYSSGMMVRLGFAVAAHLEPEILIVDEVLAVGDAEFQKKCMGKMGEVSRKDGRTILFVSHNTAAINKLCSKGLVLSDGKVDFLGDTPAALSRYLHYDFIESEVEKIINPQMRHKGGKDISLLTCALKNQLGSYTNSFAIGEEINVLFKFNSALNQNVSFWLIIFDSSGTPVMSAHQRDIAPLFNLCEGKYELEFTTYNLGLMPGSYYISAGAFNKDLGFLEWVDSCQKFEVQTTFKSGKPFDNRWGMVDLKGEWKVHKND